MTTNFKILPHEQQILSGYIHDMTGICLDESKAYLMESRLGDLLRKHNLASYTDLYLRAKSDPSKKLNREIINVITTGETSFFRDNLPFELLRNKILPDLIDFHTKSLGRNAPIPLRIWSAGCATGQEIYSVAIVLREILGSDIERYKIRLLGTDISDEAIARASRGHYNSVEIERGLGSERIARYFVREGDGWRIQDEIRAMVSFQNQNLLTSLGGLGRFDVIFCRNVAIYFNDQDRALLFSALEKQLLPHGFLIVGTTESLSGICPQWKSKRYLRTVFYQLY